MKRNTLLFLLLIIIASSSVQSQSKNGRVNPQWCIAGMQEIPNDNIGKKSILRNQIPNSTILDPNGSGVIIVPVIFHILYDPSDPAQNIPASIIQAQMNRLNTDFRRTNTDIGNVPTVWQPLAADMKFEFKLACIMPDGTPMPTPGIVYKALQPGFKFCENPNAGVPQEVCFEPKLTITNGDDAWPTDTYLNIWVFDMLSNLTLFGDATFPEDRLLPDVTIMIGGNPVTIQYKNLDGILLDYRVIGDPSLEQTFNKGRVLTHEVGHWLGLRHTYHVEPWQSICTPPGDFVTDTPPQAFLTIGCPTSTVTDACTLNSPGIMYMNYMDASSDECRIFFTTGQKDRAGSFFAQNGPVGTRFPFINNYFGIKHFPLVPPSTYTVLNNTITISINNPACLPVTYSYTGPVTLVSSTEKEIVFSVACNTGGRLHLTAKAGLVGMLHSYVDEYEFDFVNPISCQPVWPKVYTAKSPYYLNNNSGNIFLGLHEADLTAPMLNHSGFLPPNPTTNAEYTFHYNSTGLTNWAKTNLNPTFILNAGDLQLHSSSAIYPTSYINCTNGTTALPPILVPGNNETILAETNTGEIITTTTFGEIIAHSPNFPLPVTYNLGGGTIGKTIFDKSTNRIFFLRYNFPNYYFEIYTYIPLTHMFQQSHFSVLTGTGAELYQVDNSGNAYMLRSSILEKYNYSLPIPTFTAVTIIGFNNQNLIGAVSHNRYTENTCIAIQQSESNLYSLNLAAQSYKKISITNLTNSTMYTYSNDGNIVYIAAHIEGTGISLGSYAIPTLIPFTTSTFLMKLDLNVDFTSRPSSSEIVETKSYFHVRLSPNPTKSSIKLIITENNKQSNSTFTIFIVNQAGNTLIKKENYVSGHSLDISILQTGSYFIEIVNNRGEKISKNIIKL